MYHQSLVGINKSTLDLIIGFEGYRERAYQDTKGLWTIGVGHLIKSNEAHLLSEILTRDQVYDMLEDDLRDCDDAINEFIHVPLNQNQYNALCSLCFNIGVDHFRDSSVVRHLNQKNYAQAADDFLMWDKPSVLLPRRHKERAIFLA